MGTACWGATSAAGLDIAAPSGGARPASFSRDWAIEASGAEKLGNCDEGDQEGGDPEDVVVGEEREQGQHAHDLNLNLACPVRDVLGERMEAKVEEPHGEHDDDEEDDHRVEQAVRLTGCRDEERQMVGSGRVQHR